MPEKTGTIAARSEHGIKFDADGPWFNKALPDQREETWDWEEAKKGVGVRIVYNETEKDGKTYRNIFSIKVIEPSSEPASSPGEPSPGSDDQWVLKDRRLGRQTATKAAAEILAAYVGNHAGAEWEDILMKYDDLLAKAGAFID